MKQKGENGKMPEKNHIFHGWKIYSRIRYVELHFTIVSNEIAICYKKLLLAIMAFKVECLCVDNETIEHDHSSLSPQSRFRFSCLQISVEEFHSCAKSKRARKNGEWKKEREFNQFVHSRINKQNKMKEAFIKNVAGKLKLLTFLITAQC